MTKLEQGDDVFVKAKIVNVRETESGEMNYDVALPNVELISGITARYNLYFVDGKDIFQF